MTDRSDVAPSTLGVELTDDGVAVEYLDGSRVVYRQPKKRTENGVRCGPGKEVHVLVTDPTESEGVVIYVNDRRTHDDILERTGVGRVILGHGEESELFQGVRARVEDHAVTIESDPAVTGGRVFVFEEDERGERGYEIVSE